MSANGDTPRPTTRDDLVDRQYAEGRKQLTARMAGQGIPMEHAYLAIEVAS